MKLCSLPGCTNPARSDRASYCCEQHKKQAYHKMRYIPAAERLGKCALPGCNETARSTNPRSCCCTRHASMLYDREHRGRWAAQNERRVQKTMTLADRLDLVVKMAYERADRDWAGIIAALNPGMKFVDVTA